MREYSLICVREDQILWVYVYLVPRYPQLYSTWRYSLLGQILYSGYILDIPSLAVFYLEIFSSWTDPLLRLYPRYSIPSCILPRDSRFLDRSFTQHISQIFHPQLYSTQRYSLLGQILYSDYILDIPSLAVFYLGFAANETLREKIFVHILQIFSRNFTFSRENKRSEKCENDISAKMFFGKKNSSKTVSVIAATINCLKNSLL